MQADSRMCKVARAGDRHASLCAQERLQIIVTMSEVKEYLEYWLTKRTVEMKKDHEEQLSAITVSADQTCDQQTAVQGIV